MSKKPCGHSCEEPVPECAVCRLTKTQAAYAIAWGCTPVMETSYSKDRMESFKLVAPKGHANAWQGHLRDVTARTTVVIPHLDTLELLQVAVDLWRHSTIPLYFMIIDTGSPPDVCDALEGMRRNDLEIHYIRSPGYVHSSQPVSLAMDLAFAACSSEFLISTHCDVFIRKREFAQWLKDQCSAECPVVGWEMSPRPGNEWKGCVSHTATVWHMPTMRKNNIWWSLARWYEEHGPSPYVVAWPDTESGPNWCLKKAGIVPKLLGKEVNFERQKLEWYDHPRSYPGFQIYDGNHDLKKKVGEYFKPAFSAAKKRLNEWNGVPESRSAPCDHLGKRVIKKTSDPRNYYECEKGHGTVCPCQQCRTCLDYEVSD